MSSTTTEVVCGNLIRDDSGSVCFVHESKPSALGRWSLPAGRVEVGETLREAARREALEETGLVVEVGRLVGIYHAPTTLEGGSAVSFVLESHVVGGEVGTGVDELEVAFLSRAEVAALVDAHKVRGRHVAHALDAVDQGVFIDDEVVQEVPPSEPPDSA